MRVSVIQMNTSNDLARSLEQARVLIGEAVREDRPDLVVLPEVFAFMGGSPDERRASAEILPQGEAWRMLRDTARRHGIYLHGGSFFERDPEDSARLYNTTVAFSPDGAEIARYRKIHLFDVTTPDGRAYRESALVGGGSTIVVYEAAGVKVGCSICYDIRFPELYRALAKQGAQLVMVPAAFTMQTGKDHWEVLLRARAIETQTYVAAAAQWGAHTAGNEERHTYGHSMIVDPWGHVLARASDGIGFATARLDMGYLARVRDILPAHAHHRLDG